MRLWATGITAALLTTSLLAKQPGQEQQDPIRATTQLVLLPTSVTDRRGRAIEGLSSWDFVLLDGGNPRPVQLDTINSGLAPIALIMVIQTNDISLAALAKIRKIGSMIPYTVLGANGEAAVVTFDHQVKVLQDFTSDADRISDAFQKLKPADSMDAHMIDAVEESLSMIASRGQDNRAIIVIVGESRDRGSEGKLTDLVAKLQRSAVTIYSLTYSAYLTPFTMKPEEYVPPSGGGPITAIRELARLAKQNTEKALTTDTGGWRLSFQTKSKLENDLLLLGNEIHGRYYLSFKPQDGEAPGYHALELQVKGRPDAIVRTRRSFWLSQPVQ